MEKIRITEVKSMIEKALETANTEQRTHLMKIDNMVKNSLPQYLRVTKIAKHLDNILKAQR